MDGDSKDNEQTPELQKPEENKLEPEEETPRGLTGNPAPCVQNKLRFMTPEEDLLPLPSHKEEQ